MNIAISIPNILFITGISAALYSIRKIGWKNIVTILVKIVAIAYVYATVMNLTSSVTMSIISAILTEMIFRIDVTKIGSVIKTTAYYGSLTSFAMFLFVFLNV